MTRRTPKPLSTAVEDFPDLLAKFNELAPQGVLGVPAGRPAFAYLRVSSEEQGEEGRSGLPRQLLHIHEAAQRDGYAVAMDRIYVDDHSGFEFERRPALSRLRNEYPRQVASAVIIEHLDRLSRNVDWHQGYLLDEMQQHGIKPVFWQAYTSRVERMVMGAISQDAMLQSLARMKEGHRLKAQSGRVTAKRRAYGYQFCDSRGVVQQKPGKDTYYQIYEPEAVVVRRIFEEVASGTPMRQLASQFIDQNIPPPRNFAAWDPSFLRNIIKNPLYKGEYVHGRSLQTTSPEGKSLYQRLDPSEWTIVPVPAIVSAALWQAANDLLVKNKQMAERNGKRQYLLTGLIKCAECGYAWSGYSHYSKSENKGRLEYLKYRCSSRANRLGMSYYGIECHQKPVMAAKLDNAVWTAICKLLLEPEHLSQALDALLNDEQNVKLQMQIDYLAGQIVEAAAADERLKRAYLAGGFDAAEFAAERQQIRSSVERQQQEIEALQARVIDPVQMRQRHEMLKRIAAANRNGSLQSATFDEKRRILKLLVDRVEVNTIEGLLNIQGSILPSGVVDMNSNDIYSNNYSQLKFTLRCNFDLSVLEVAV